MNTPTRFLPLLGLALALTGCPEPVPTGEPSGTAGSEGAAMTPGGDDVPSPGGNAPNAARWDVAAGEGVKLTGRFVYEGEKAGRYRLDFKALPDGPGAPSLVHTLELREPGEWSASAPKDAGRVEIIAFIDVDGDGPTPGDPAGITTEPIVVAGDPVPDIDIMVVDEPDESVMNPRARWPDPQEAGGGGPGDGPAPDGPPPDGPPPDGPPPDGPPPDGPPPDGPPPDGPPPDGPPPEGAAPAGEAAEGG